MKVLHINTFQMGGAGLCALRIGRATQKLGIEVKFLVAYGEEFDNVYRIKPDFSIWNINGFFRKVKTLMIKMYLWQGVETQRYIISQLYGERLFSVPRSEYQSLAEHPLVQEADIIHLHWVAGFVDYPTFFEKVDKPIVWTIHDENPGLGGLHYTIWGVSLNKKMMKVERRFVQTKKKALKKAHTLNLVAISSEMKNFLENNEVLHGFPVTLIHNGIDGNMFVPYDRLDVRKRLDLNNDGIVILFTAYYITEDRKGLSDLLSALEILHIESLTLICIGKYTLLPKTSIDIRCVGQINDSRVLSEYYSAADYFCMPSYQEAFAQTPMEAMACGTPVISYPCSGARDLINENNGVVCSDFTVHALCEGIKKAMSMHYDRKIIRENLLKRFSYETIAKQYINLYNQVLSQNGTRNY